MAMKHGTFESGIYFISSLNKIGYFPWFRRFRRLQFLTLVLPNYDTIPGAVTIETCNFHPKEVLAL